LFVIGVLALGLLVIGIHNAWDAITHIVLTGDRGERTESPGAGSE
jgi:hypothetical protein